MANAASAIIEHAVVRSHAEPGAKLLDKAFAFAFRGLVYAQIWEDPVVDMAGLALNADSRVVTIASGGCNAMSYLTGNPAAITAVDLNTAHIALGKLKIALLRAWLTQFHATPLCFFAPGRSFQAQVKWTF